MAEVLWSDICLKSEKLEVINWQPENCEGMFSAPREPELFIRCNFTLFSLIFGVAKENGTYNSHSAVKIPTLLLLLFFFLRRHASRQFSQHLKRLVSIPFLLYNRVKYIKICSTA